MVWRHLILATSITAAFHLLISSAPAQQVTVTTPLQSVGERFFESTNVGWSFGVGNNVVFRFGSPGMGAPPFGGFNPNAGLSAAQSVQSGDFGANFRFNFAQGAERTHITTAPVLTLTNGVPGSLFIGSQRPFVVGLVPVVGSPGFMPPVVQQPSNSIASRVLRGELQLPPRDQWPDRDDEAQLNKPSGPRPLRGAEITVPPAPSELREQRAAEQAADQLDARKYFDKARDAEQKGKPKVAVIFYRLAARKASGELQQDAQRRLTELTQQ